MELHQLEYAVEVANENNFTRAALKLNVSQSALSHQNSKLEKELGIKLFIRNARDIALTEIGEDFIGRARNILSNILDTRQCIDEYRGLLKGSIRIGVIAAIKKIGFAEMITEFYKAHPQIKFYIEQNGTNKSIKRLINKKIDMALLTMPEIGSYPMIDFAHLAEDEYVLAVSKSHPLAKDKYVDIANLKNEKFIAHTSNDLMHFTLIKACKEAGFMPNIICESSHPSTSLSLIIAGMGIGLFPKEKLESLSPRVAVINLKKQLKKEIVLAKLKDRGMPPAVKTFEKFTNEWIKKYNR